MSETLRDFHVQRVSEWEKEMEGKLEGFTRFPDSHFRRIGLPILTGLLDNTFNPAQWREYIGSDLVGLQILDDLDYTKVLFELPPSLQTGPALINSEEHATLSQQSDMIGDQGQIIAENGVVMMHNLINGTLSHIDQVMYARNHQRACETITTLNKIFKHYGVRGEIPFPEGLHEADKTVTGTVEEIPKTQRRINAFDDGESI